MGIMMRLPLAAVGLAEFTARDTHEETKPPAEGWAPERLWLSRECWDPDTQKVMAEVVGVAATVALASGSVDITRRLLLAELHATGRRAAALRLTARVLRGSRAQATAVGCDLAATALLLAAVRDGYLLAAIEFAAEASGRAVTLEDERDDRPMPPGIGSVPRLAGRMRAQARAVLNHRLSWPDLDTVGPSLVWSLAEDPLGTSHQTR